MQVTPLSPLMAVSQLQGNDGDPTQEGQMLKSVKDSTAIIGAAAIELIHHAKPNRENLGAKVDTYA